MDDKKEENKGLPGEEQSKKKSKEDKDLNPPSEKAPKESDKTETEVKVEDALSGFDVKKGKEAPAEKKKGKKEEKAPSEDSKKASEDKTSKVKKEESPKEKSPKEEKGDKEKSSEEHHEVYEFDDEDHEEHEEEDYDKLNKEELLEKIKEDTGQDIIKISEKRIDAIKEAFFHLIDQDKEQALEEFLKEEGNTKDDFEFTKDKDLVQQFKTYYDGFKEKKKKAHSDLNQLKEENLKRKEELLEELRQFVDEEEDNVGIKKLKEIESEWKNAEPIPNNYTRELWANFNALRDRFYDKRSIFFELKDLDRKKNEKLKKEVIERAKELLTINPVNAAVAELKKLHEEYKHIGPVPQEIRAQLWEEFKNISDKVHERKQVVAAEFKKKLDENLEKKKVLITKLETFIDYSSDKISEWNEKSREILNIQEEWKKIGPVPRELSKEISKSFWSHFKGFFKSKQQFFKALDEAREKNYDLKVKLCEQVEEINKSTEDLAQQSEKVKQIQREWKNIGPAPRKKSEDVYKRFKSACDAFFDNLRGNQKEREKDFEANLRKKNEIVEKIKTLKSLREENLEEVENLIKEWTDLGFVPKKAIKSSKKAINEAIDSIIEKANDFKEDSLEMAKTKLRALMMKSDFKGSRNIHGEIDKMRRQISKLQDNAVTLKNNMEFFASTKNAEKLKDDVQSKVDQAEEQIQKLKDKIKLLRQIDK
ncbi:DUF349 domain-containing protein [Hyphobacterium sp. CCMP332]|nr:DUF349 domain-containing protein [Hyphobacterium sp. CCMP332]